MKNQAIRQILLIGVLAAGLGACAGGDGRYPDLMLSDFDRVEGSFNVGSASVDRLRPAPLEAKAIDDVDEALSRASIQHNNFLMQADEARSVVAKAAGTNVEDNSWPRAQVEIAILESRNGETMSLLADLDLLYADATLSFNEREHIATARDEVANFHAAERQVIAELIGELGSNDRTRAR